MATDFLRTFELKEMLQHPDYNDQEGMIYLAARLRELPENNRARFYFEKYCRLTELGRENGLSLADILDENISIAEKHPKLTTELRAIIAAAGWYAYYNKEKSED